MQFKRVHIIGGAGSGKTTLARQYAAATDAAHYELDDLYYLEIAARTKRAKTDRDEQLAKAIAGQQWVIDGIFWQPWVQPSLERADKIIILAVPERTRHLRVVTRHFRYLPRAPVRQWRYFFPTLVELLRHNRAYDGGPLQETQALIAPYAEKVSICRSNAAAHQALGL